MATENNFDFSPQACPCKFCTTDRHPGCHTVQCPNGWFEWNEYMADRRNRRYKETQERQRWWLFRKESLAKARSRKSSQKYARRKRGDTEA